MLIKYGVPQKSLKVEVEKAPEWTTDFVKLKKDPESEEKVEDSKDEDLKEDRE